MGGLIAREPASRFTPCPEGLHQAVCVDVEDCGVCETPYGPKHKVQLRRFPDPVLKGLGAKAAAVVEDISSSDPFSKQVYDSFAKFRKDSSGYTRITEQAYSHARALTFG